MDLPTIVRKRSKHGRSSSCGLADRIYVSAGVASMAPEHKAEIMRRLLNVVLLADHHHAGSFDFEDTTVFWEIGTYGLDDLSRERAGHSAPERVLTVLLAEEY